MTGRKQIAYRCPSCGVATVSFLGNLASRTDMLRLRCDCGESALTIQKIPEEKIRLSVPCVYCKTEHASVISREIAERDETVRIPCPFSGMNILFMANEDEMSNELDKSAQELSSIMASFEVDNISDIQPEDIDEEYAPPDPAIYDIFNFILRDIEADGGIKCPCSNGEYDLRFTDNGMQIYCKNCGASKSFAARTSAMAEEYLYISTIELK